MGPVAISTLLLAALAGLAVTPMAAAAPEQPACNGVWAVTETVGPVTVFASPPCYEVSVDAMSCPLAGSWKEARVGQVAVRIYTCDSPAEASAMAPPCTCPPPPRCTSVTTVGPVAAIVSVTVTSDCRVIVALLHGTVDCGDPLDGQVVVSQGRVSVVLPCGDIDSCEPPLECYPPTPPAASSAMIPPVCIEKEVQQGPVRAGFDQCRGDHETHPCYSVQRIHHYEQVGPVWAQADLCLPHTPPPAAASAAGVELPNPCGPDANCQGPECPAESFETNVDHRNAVTTTRDCQVFIVTGEGQICVGAWSGHSRHEVGPVTWDRYYCEFPGGDPIELQATSAAAPSPVASEALRVVTNPDGTVDVYVKVDVMDCLWGEGYQRTAEAGPLTLWTWGCNPPYPPYEAASTAAAAPPSPCGATNPAQRCPAPVPPCSGVKDPMEGAVDVDVSPSCQATVSIDLIDCVWNEQWVEHRAGPATVRYTTCSGPDPTATMAAEAPPCTCPPPQPLCRPINEAVADYPDAIDWSVSDSCKPTVHVDVTEIVSCIFGRDETRTVGPVSVTYPVCEAPCSYDCQPPVATAAADPFPTCIRECSPVPIDGCDLQAATPEPLRGALWGTDCDIDVDPIGACAPPSGTTKEFRLAFVHVRLLLCGGGLPPIS